MTWWTLRMEAPSCHWTKGAPIRLEVLVEVDTSDSSLDDQVTACVGKVMSAREARELAQQLLRFAEHAESVPFNPRGIDVGDALPVVRGGSR